MASTFDLLAAIDLRAGHVVRLEQGDFTRETRFGDDPVAVARGFVAAGADWLHVVDLDGAQSGEPRQLAAVRTLSSAVSRSIRIEVSGGLRSAAAVDDAFAAGAARVVLGTAALRDPVFAGRAIEIHGRDHVAVAIDVRDGRAVGEAWRPGAPGTPVSEAIASLVEHGVTVFEVTAIERDGLRGGPDLDLLRSLQAPGRAIIASGGISSASDIMALRDLGCAGAILGRALYEGDLLLADIVRALER